MNSRHKFLLSFFIAVFIMIVMIKFFDYQGEQLRVLKESIQLSYKIHTDALKMRKNEKNFVHFLGMDHVKKFYTHYDVLVQDLKSLDKFLGQPSEFSPMFTQVLDATYRYKIHFDSIVQHSKKIGLNFDQGAKGRVRECAQAVHTDLLMLAEEYAFFNEHVKDYRESLLRLEISEKKFLLRPSPKYVAQIRSEFIRLFAAIEQEHSLSEQDKCTLKENVHYYQATLEELCDLILRFVSPEGVMWDLSNSAHFVESIIENLSRKILDKVVMAEQSSRASSVFFVFSVVLGLLLFALMPFILLMVGRGSILLIDDSV